MVLWFLLLLSFWVVLSGKIDIFHISLGVFSAALVSVWCRRLVHLPQKVAGILPRTLHRWPGYIPWLLWQIVVAACHVAYVVMHPKMPIDPKIIRFRKEYPNSLAHLTLANSITLTPGTVTLNVEGHDYVVHAIDQVSADGLVPDPGPKGMQGRIERVFRGTEKRS